MDTFTLACQRFVVACWWQGVVVELRATYVHEAQDGETTARVVGRLQSVNAFSMKATCRWNHGSRCVCWVSLKSGGEEARQPLRENLLEWLARGQACTAEAHAAMATDLKRSKGMRVR